jgi:hypothetical protein
MKTRLIKEALSLLPAWLVGLALPLGLWLSRNSDREIVALLSISVWLGCALVGAYSFGHEYNHRTMALLLSQPISRRQIWYEKMLVLGIALFTLCLFPTKLLLSSVSSDIVGQEILLGVAAPALCAFAASPALTLWLKHTLAAVLFAPLLPFLLGAIIWGAARVLAPNETAELAEAPGTIWMLVAGYAGLMYLFGCCQFKRLQSRDALGKDLQLGWVKTGLTFLVELATLKSRGPYASLVKKELLLHKLNFLLAMMLCLASVGAVVVKRLWPDISGPALLIPLSVYCLVIPFTIGALTVAEERHLGLHEWQLTLPVARWKQWTVKIGLAYALMVLLGILLPWGIEQWLYLPTGLQVPYSDPDSFYSHLHIVAYIFATMTIALYASSFSSNTIRAAIMAVGMSVATLTVNQLLLSFLGYFGSQALSESRIFQQLRLSSEARDSLDRVCFNLLVWGFCALGGWLLAAALVNFRRNEFRRETMWVQPLVFCVVAGVFGAALFLIRNGAFAAPLG